MRQILIRAEVSAFFTVVLITLTSCTMHSFETEDSIDAFTSEKPVAPYVYPVKASGGLFADVEDIACFVIAGMTGSCFASPESGEGIVIPTNSQRSWPLIAQMLSDWSRCSSHPYSPVSKYQQKEPNIKHEWQCWS